MTVVGGGLAGSEAAWQAAALGVPVVLYEMRPARTTPAHVSGSLAELVCSNSLGSDAADRAAGVLKAELRMLRSLLLECAEQARVPAGSALAVDREVFAQLVTAHIEGNPRITLVRREMVEVPPHPCVIATGPLTSEGFAQALSTLIGGQYLHFYDAVAPIVAVDSVDTTVAFRQSRHQVGEGDYLNCPMSETEYARFVDELVNAERIALRDFEKEDARFFEACLPVEVLAQRGREALAFGPLRPVGLIDPRTGQRPYAVVQLRQDNQRATLYNMVGFQTNLRFAEQQRVFRMIPGLEHAEFVRYGQMHRNTFVNAPQLLDGSLMLRDRDGVFLAGQITGIEGYVGAIGSGWLAGVNAARRLLGQPTVCLPSTTMLGALCEYISSADPASFQPMKANFGLMPELPSSPRAKLERNRAHAERSRASVAAFRDAHGFA